MPTQTPRFLNRHIGPTQDDQHEMLTLLGVPDLDTLIDQTVPDAIRLKAPLKLTPPMSEFDALAHMRELGNQNKIFQSLIGLGYSDTVTPPVIQRNIFENPGWYTQYTPYQAEISQGRLEALFTFQTMIAELTGLPVANASLLDEATAAAEAMTLLHRVRPESKQSANTFLLVGDHLPQSEAVIRTRAGFLGITVKHETLETLNLAPDVFGIMVAYPQPNGQVQDFSALTHEAKVLEIGVAVAADLLALTLLTPPGEWGADVCIGSSQRFGVPLGYGGPHAAFIAVADAHKRSLPGRIIGISKDQVGNPAYRMALQTREQHIRREKATSNICTAQALLAIMAGMYAVYHGADGLIFIAKAVAHLAQRTAAGLTQMGYRLESAAFFDTITVHVRPEQRDEIHAQTQIYELNLGYTPNGAIRIAFNETCTEQTVTTLLSIFAQAAGVPTPLKTDGVAAIPEKLHRKSKFCQQEVFKRYHSESLMMRYIKSLENKDLSLTSSMIPLGSCTMKLNAVVQMMPLSWPQWSRIHPFAPIDQSMGYQKMIHALEHYLSEITGFSACSLQPNSGAQGEYAGLLSIREYQKSIGQGHRDMVLIPSSAHGTNPATAALAGMKIKVVACDENGNIDLNDLRQKAAETQDTLSALMITYPSTHGVFEVQVKEICDIIHQNGGQVYMDGANMNAQVGLTNPATIGADVCHLNLHKTFAIPHGGGGPGMGPICVASHLAPFLPGHPLVESQNQGPCVSAAPWGSASILLISYLYIRLLGAKGVTESTKVAILNANYIKAKLEPHYSILYHGHRGRVAHELILDLRPFKKISKIEPEDVAKRLMDYGFHAPTMSFPVPGTLMIEPTESEDRAELDRFCDAMIQIRKEIEQISQGQASIEDNVLKQAPHTAKEATATQWNHAYSREEAVYPLPYLTTQKFWPPVKRIDNAYGDRNLICTCAPVHEYQESIR